MNLSVTNGRSAVPCLVMLTALSSGPSLPGTAPSLALRTQTESPTGILIASGEVTRRFRVEMVP